jgi:hypothetical protein
MRRADVPQSSIIDLTYRPRVSGAGKTRRRLLRSVPIERHHLLESAPPRAEAKPSLAWRLLQSFVSRTDQD